MSIRLDNIPISEYNLKCELEHDHPALFSTRDYSNEIPGMPGAHDFGADRGPKPFNLPIKIFNVSSNNEIALAMRKFTTALVNPDGTLKTVKLSFDYEPEKFYMARYSGNLPLQRLVYQGVFNLPLNSL
jgi:phage-related protein